MSLERYQSFAADLLAVINNTDPTALVDVRDFLGNARPPGTSSARASPAIPRGPAVSNRPT
ncbi:MAG: hypothetical protein JWP63_4820 [Candidatus Solibacter sp.]|nr:hypothetical protein [Candidatus Solibacter sp.]